MTQHSDEAIAEYPDVPNFVFEGNPTALMRTAFDRGRESKQHLAAGDMTDRETIADFRDEAATAAERDPDALWYAGWVRDRLDAILAAPSAPLVAVRDEVALPHIVTASDGAGYPCSCPVLADHPVLSVSPEEWANQRVLVAPRDAILTEWARHGLDPKDTNVCICGDWMEGDGWDDHIVDALLASGILKPSSEVEAAALEAAAAAVNQYELDRPWLRARAARVRSGKAEA